MVRGTKKKKEKRNYIYKKWPREQQKWTLTQDN
jgi:hypothetical protein